MCDVNGPFKLCTCSEKIDKSIPHWILKYNKKDGVETMVVGMFSQPNTLFTPIIRRNILSRLNSKDSIFDFNYSPQKGDLLKLCGEFDEYYLEFENGKWNWIENFDYISKNYGKFQNKKRGYVEGTESKLIQVIKEYDKLTNSTLYRNDEFGYLEPKNDFEKELYNSDVKRSQKELIELIQKEIES